MPHFPANLDDGERRIPPGILLAGPALPAPFPPSPGDHALSLRARRFSAGSGHPLFPGARRFSAGVLPYGSRPRPPPPTPLMVPQQLQRSRGIYRGQFQPPNHARSWNGFRPTSPVPPSRPVIPYRAAPPQAMMSDYLRPHRPLITQNRNFRSAGTGVFIPRVVPNQSQRMEQGIWKYVEPGNIDNMWRSPRMGSEARASMWKKEEPPIEDVLPSEWTY